MKYLISVRLMAGLVLVAATAVAHAEDRVNRLVDFELLPGGGLVGTMHPVALPGTIPQPVMVFRGPHLVAEAVPDPQGSFQFDGLSGGVYWVCARQVTGESTGRAIRAWTVGTSPPGATRSLQLRTAQTVVPGLPTYTYSQPLPSSPYLLQPGPGVPGLYPFGPYPRARMFFPDPIVAAAVVGGIAGVIIVANDDDDNDRPPASPSG